VLVLSFGILIAARNIIVRVCLEQEVRVITGLNLDIGKLDIGFGEPTVAIKDLKLYNPSGYTDPVMADVGEIYFRYKPGDMLKGKIYLYELRITLKELSVIRRSGNDSNYNALRALQPHGNGPPLPLTIDDFSLNVGTVVFKDYAYVSPPLVKTYNLNLKERYKNVQGVNDLERLIMISVLSKTSIANVLKVDLNKLKEDLPGTLLNSLQTADNPIKELLNNLKL
jgi:hypothetical protein